MKTRNIREVLQMWKEREKEELATKAELVPHPEPQGRVDVDDVVLLNEDELLTVLNDDIDTDRPGEDDEELLDEDELLTVLNVVDDEDVNTDRPDLTPVDLTGKNSLINIDCTGLEGPSTSNTPPEIMNRLVPDLRRKRKEHPDGIDQDSPVLKRRNTPGRGASVMESGNYSQNQAKLNLITNHFRSHSLANYTGGDARAVGEAAVEGGGGGDVRSAVQGARAKPKSGLTGGAIGGKTKQAVTRDSIGAGQTADIFLANPGKSNIQLLMEKFQRGNARNSKDSKRQ